MYYFDQETKTSQWERPPQHIHGTAEQEEVAEDKVLEWFAALLARQDEVSGTPAYMAPEQMLQNRALISRQTDIYNLAAVMFYLASKRFPVPPATARRWLRRVHRGQERVMDTVREERRQLYERVCLQHLTALFDTATPHLSDVIQDKDDLERESSGKNYLDDLMLLDDILCGALHTNPGLRYRDAGQMQQRLSSLLSDVE
jgi:serine/threonine protein kinase